MDISHKKKRCYFFCYEGAAEAKRKNVRKSLENQEFGLETFFVKGSNMGNYGNYSRN